MASKLELTLAHLGLSGLHPCFRKEKIDDSLLAGLTDSDLREVGVAKLGDRKRLLAAFSNPAPAYVTVDPTAAAEPADKPARVLHAGKVPKEDGDHTDNPAKAAMISGVEPTMLIAARSRCVSYGIDLTRLGLVASELATSTIV